MFFLMNDNLRMLSVTHYNTIQLLLVFEEKAPEKVPSGGGSINK